MRVSLFSCSEMHSNVKGHDVCNPISYGSEKKKQNKTWQMLKTGQSGLSVWDFFALFLQLFCN